MTAISGSLFVYQQLLEAYYEKLEIHYPEDIEKIRKFVPEMGHLRDHELEFLYIWVSGKIFFAQGMVVDQGFLQVFKEEMMSKKIITKSLKTHWKLQGEKSFKAIHTHWLKVAKDKKPAPYVVIGFAPIGRCESLGYMSDSGISVGYDGNKDGWYLYEM